MPLIHAIEFSNFMNYRRKVPWSPDWRHAHFLLKGLHTAINIPNGRGKSTVIQTVLSMLVWDTKSLREMKRTHWSPAGNPAFTHVRIEITNRNLIQSGLFAGMSDPTDGSHMVFGVYGHSTDEKPEFYAYHGTLDDCPIAVVEQSRTTLVTEKEFLDRLGRLKSTHGLFPAHPRDRLDSEWRRFVGDYFDMSSLQQQHKYQLANGAEGSAKYFDVDQPRGNYSAELFYKHLAPELLSELMGGYGEEDERGIEDTIHEKARGVVRARRETEQRAVALGEAQRVLTALGHLTKISASINSKEQEVLAAQKVLAAEYFALEDALIKRPIPGMPRPPGPELPSFYQDFVLQDGEWWISDRGLSLFSDDEPKRMNERAGRPPIIRSVELRTSQVLDFKCDLSSGYANGGRPGWKPRLFNRENALALIEKTPRFRAAWNRETVLAELDKAFDWVSSRGDTNPARARLVVVERQIRKNKEMKGRVEVAQAETNLDLEANKRDLQQLEATAGAWQQVVDSGLFSRDELGGLEDLKNSTDKEAIASEKAHRTHHQMVGERKSSHEHWKEFIKVHEDLQPAALANRLVEQSAIDSERVESLVEALRKARDQVMKARDTSERADRSWNLLETRISKANDLIVLAQGYPILFGTTNPVNLEATVLRAVREARQKKDKHQGELNRFTPALEAIEAFQQAQPATSPGKWLSIRRARKLEYQERLQKAKHDSLELGVRLTRAERLRGEAHAFNEYYGSETPIGLELKVRSELRVAESELNSHVAQLARWEGQLNAISTFRQIESTLDPIKWLTDRRSRREHAQAELNRDRPALIEASTLRKALDDAPVAPGAIARNVARIAGDQSVSLHDFIEKLSLEGERKKVVLTLFSALLFSPVFADIAAAKAAATVLAEKEIEAPVFLGPALEAFCRSANVNFDGDSANALFVGVRTRKVECLLDPMLIEREKQLLDERISQLKGSCSAMQACLDDLAVHSEIEPIAQLAAQALVDDIPNKAAVLETKARTLRARLPLLTRRADEVAIATIRASLQLRSELKLSGEVKELEVKAELAKLHRLQDERSDMIGLASGELKKLEQDDHLDPVAEVAARALNEGIPAQAAGLRGEIDRLVESLPGLEERASPDAVEAIRSKIRLDEFLDGESMETLLVRRERATDERTRAKAELVRTQAESEKVEKEKEAAELARRASADAALEVGRLRALQNYVDDPQYGPHFMADHELEGAKLHAAMVRAEKRTKFDFKTAETFSRNGGESRLLGLQARRSELKANAEKLEKDIRDLSKAIEDAYPVCYPLQRAAIQIDTAIHKLLHRWSHVALALESPPIVSSEQLPQQPLWISAEKWRSLEKAEEVAEQMSNECDALVTPERASVIETLKNARASLKRAEDLLCSEIDRTLVDVSLKLPETARVKLAQSKMTPEYLTEMLETSEASFAKNAEANRIANVHLNTERTQLSDWLSNFTLRLPDNLKTLRTVFSPNHGAQPGQSRAGFEIDATVIDNNGIGLLIEKIIGTVEDLENGQLAATGTPEKLRVQIQKTLRETIRETFYREVILNPRIRLVLPSISGRALEMERKMASSGQGVAITFLWILKLADFINEREIRRQTVDGAKRRRVRDKASAFTLLDGAFSHLSDKNLINETLAGIENSLGRFQLIITGHDPAYENDFNRFPAFVAAREMNGHYMRASSHHHTLAQDDEPGLMESFHAIHVSKPAPKDQGKAL